MPNNLGTARPRGTTDGTKDVRNVIETAASQAMATIQLRNRMVFAGIVVKFNSDGSDDRS
jgi:hypothetical protein